MQHKIDEKNEKPKKPSISPLKLGYRLFKKRKEIMRGKETSVEQLKAMIESWKAPIAKLQGLIKQIGTEFNKAFEPTEHGKGLDTLWGKFSSDVDEFVKKIGLLTTAVEQANEEQIAENVSGLMNQASSLLGSMHALNLETELTKLLPESLANIQQSLTSTVNRLLVQLFPEGGMSLSDHVKKFIREGHDVSQSFSELSDLQKNVELMGLGFLNNMLREFFLFMDKTGVMMSIKEGYFSANPFEFLQGYDYQVVSNEWKSENLKEGVFYLKTISRGIQYTLKIGEKNIIATIEFKNLSLLQQTAPLTEEQVKLIFGKILQDAHDKKYITLQNYRSISKKLGDAYEQCMEQAGYAFEDEIFPFTTSVTEQRKMLSAQFKGNRDKKLLELKEQFDEQRNNFLKDLRAFESIQKQNSPRRSLPPTDSPRTTLSMRLASANFRNEGISGFIDDLAESKEWKKLTDERKDEEQKRCSEFIRTLRSIEDSRKSLIDKTEARLEEINKRNAKDLMHFEVNLMSTPRSNSYEASDQYRLFLYKEKDGRLFYIFGDELFFLEDDQNQIPENIKKNLKFDQAENDFKKSSDTELCEAVLNITSTRGHTCAKRGSFIPNPKPTPADVAKHTINNIKEIQESFRKAFSALSQNEKKDSQSQEESLTKLKNAINGVETHLKSVLDKDIYARYFSNAERKDEVRAAKEESKYDQYDNIISELGASFKKTKNIIADLKLLKQENTNKKLSSPEKNIMETGDKVAKTAKDFGLLLEHLAVIKKNPLFIRLTSIPGLKEEGKDMLSQFSAYQFPDELLATVKSSDRNQEDAERADSPFDKLKRVYDKLDAAYKDRNDAPTIHRVLGSLQSLVENRPRSVNNVKPIPKMQWLNYFISHYDSIKTLMDKGKWALASSEYLLKEFGVQLLRALNLFFKDLFLLLDRIELQLYLQEGLLSTYKFIENTSLHEVMQGFYNNVSAAGYEFPVEERYPYADHIKNQREQWLATNKFDAKLLQARIDNQHYNPIVTNDGRNLDEKHNPPGQPEVTKQDLINKIDLEIEQYKKQRASRYYFYAATKRSVIEDIYIALTHLKEILSKQGYDFQAAIKELQATALHSYDVLIVHANDFLNNLDEQNKLIAPVSFGKKVISSSNHNPFLTNKEEKMKVNDVVDQPKSITDNFVLSLMSQRTNELNQEWALTSTKMKKIELLAQLSEYFRKPSVNFKQAVAYIKRTRPADHYLLFEGRTGAMMKQIELFGLTKTDMLRKLDLEAMRLKEKLKTNYYFFASSRKATIQSRINAINELMANMRNNNFKEAFNQITAKNQAILNKYESTLMRDIQNYEDSQFKSHTNAELVLMRSGNQAQLPQLK